MHDINFQGLYRFFLHYLSRLKNVSTLNLDLNFSIDQEPRTRKGSIKLKFHYSHWSNIGDDGWGYILHLFGEVVIIRGGRHLWRMKNNSLGALNKTFYITIFPKNQAFQKQNRWSGHEIWVCLSFFK